MALPGADQPPCPFPPEFTAKRLAEVRLEFVVEPLRVPRALDDSEWVFGVSGTKEPLHGDVPPVANPGEGESAALSDTPRSVK